MNTSKSETILYRCHWCRVVETLKQGETAKLNWRYLHGWWWCGCAGGRKFKRLTEKCKDEDEFTFL